MNWLKCVRLRPILKIAFYGFITELKVASKLTKVCHPSKSWAMGPSKLNRGYATDIEDIFHELIAHIWD